MTETLAVTSLARVPTPKASGYLQQLCKHFGHKIPATFDETSGHLTFTSGECRLTAEPDVLLLACASPDQAQLETLQDIIARHLQRFTFREELVIDWQPA